ncbi:unnamed protein product, partial [marine sediment metagenome]
DNVALYEALRAELVDAGCGLEAHIPMNKAMIELLNPYERDNKLKSKWLEKLDFKVKDANTEQADFLYFVGCTAAFKFIVSFIRFDFCHFSYSSSFTIYLVISSSYEYM